jgi:hypothetical protein
LDGDPRNAFPTSPPNPSFAPVIVTTDVVPAVTRSGAAFLLLLSVTVGYAPHRFAQTRDPV